MKILAPALVVFALFVQLTSREGKPIAVNIEQTAAVVPCGDNVGAAVITNNVSICVRETVAEVIEKFRSAK